MNSLIQDALDMGYRHIDTAEMYGAGHAEQLVGQALSSCPRDKIFLTTKVETFDALNLAVAEGKTLRVGVSNFDLPLRQEAQRLCTTPIANIQVRFNLHTCDPEQSGLLRYCQRHHIAVTAYSPLKDDVLNFPAVQGVAWKHGGSPVQVAWHRLLRKPWVAAIPMSTNRLHLRPNPDAGRLELDEEDLRQLDAAA